MYQFGKFSNFIHNYLKQNWLNIYLIKREKWCSLFGILKFNSKFFKAFKSKAIHKPSAQHVLDDDYYKRIEAIQFTMTHDDGKKVDDLSQADVILLGVSRTSKTQPQFI